MWWIQNRGWDNVDLPKSFSEVHMEGVDKNASTNLLCTDSPRTITVERARASDRSTPFPASL